MTQFVAPVPSDRADDSRGAANPPLPAPADYLELCRREFARRYFQQVNGDDYEFSPNVYEGE
jgi:hypothetical protein